MVPDRDRESLQENRPYLGCPLTALRPIGPVQVSVFECSVEVRNVTFEDSSYLPPHCSIASALASNHYETHRSLVISRCTVYIFSKVVDPHDRVTEKKGL